ncbi:MAG: hypothetical protein HFJ28_03850 [Clostridia bacterium]|nr:hypothetical protein [Clostridia bacterium]
MQHCKNFKKVLSILLAMVMLMTISAPAFATEAPESKQDINSTVSTSNETASASYILKEINWSTNGYSGSKSYTVTPTKGYNLWMRVVNSYQLSGDIRIEIFNQNGVLRKGFTIYGGTGSTQYKVIDGCDGGRYTIRITGSVMAQYYAMVYQLEVL